MGSEDTYPAKQKMQKTAHPSQRPTREKSHYSTLTEEGALELKKITGTIPRRQG